MEYWLHLGLAAILGMAVGSFLNVVSDRLPSGGSLISPPSHCPNCDTKIGRRDLVPVFSYLILRGKCRNCSSRIPVRILIVELITGALFAFIWAKYGWTLQGLGLMGYASLFLAVFIIDMEHHIIPNKVVIVGLIGSIILASFWPDVGPLKAIIGAGVGFGVLLILYLIPGAVVGEGDVKLAAVVGAATGFPVVVVGIGLSFVIGGSVAILLLLFKRRGRKDQFAFGPFIAVSALIALIWGESIIQWYVGNFLSF